MGSILTIWRLFFTTCVITFLVTANCAGASEITSAVIPLKYAKAEDVAARLDQSTPAVAKQIVADRRSNSLLVFGSKEQIEIVKRQAETADVVLPQVLVEAAVLELESPVSQKAGGLHHQHQSLATTDRFLGSSICWTTNLVRMATANAVSDGPEAFTYVAGLGNSLGLTIAALTGERQVKVIQKPRIQTSSGVPASLFIGETVPYVGGTCDDNSGSPHSCRPQLKMGIQLEITPVIASAGAIAIDLKSTAEETMQSAVSVTVTNGNMLLIGGAIHTEKQQFPPTISRGAMLDRSNRPRSTELLVLLRFSVLPLNSDLLGAK